MLAAAKIRYLVVHCADTPDDQALDARDIHQMHLGFGWHGIGYHRVICRDGLIQQGRPDFWVGAHVRGFNDVSLGVCLIGRSEFTNAQFTALENVLRTWKRHIRKQISVATVILTIQIKPVRILMWRIGVRK